MGEVTKQQEAPQGEAPPSTPLDELRAEFAKEIVDPRLFKRFPRAGGRVAGEFRPSNKKEVREAAAAENDEFILTETLVRLLIHDPDRADKSTEAGQYGLVPLGEYAGRADLDPLRFDNRLADLLGLPQSGRPDKIALELFEGNDLQLAEMAGEIAQWSLDTHNASYQSFERAS